MDVIHISRHFTEELALATDEWLWVVSNNVIETVVPQRINFKQYCMHNYVVLIILRYIIHF